MPETDTHNAQTERPTESAKPSRPNGRPALPPVELESIQVLPEHIALHPKLSLLRIGRLTEASVKELADTIEEEGQLEAALVRPNPDRKNQESQPWQLVYGHRRLEACRALKTTLRCDVRELDEDEALRSALLENWQRKDFTIAERSRHVAMLRQEYGWTGPRGTKLIAHHLGVGEATVTQMDRMAGLPKDVLERVDAGEMTARAALELAPVKDEARPAVSKRAQELAEEAQRQTDERRKGLTPKTEKPAKVEGKHVRQAARETKGALPRPHAPDRAMIRAWWQAHEGPIYPRVLAAFVSAHIAWMEGGKGKTDKWLEAALEDVADELQKTDPATTKSKPSLKAKAVKKSAIKKPKTVKKSKAKRKR